MQRPLPLLILGAALFAVPFTPVSGQQADAPAAVPARAPEEPADPLGRDTPLGSMMGFLQAAEAFDWTLAAEFLDLRNLPARVRKVDGATLAEELYFVLQRRDVVIDGASLSDEPEGHAYDNLPEYRDELGRIESSEGEVTLLLQQVPGPERRLIWKVSNATVAQVPELYDEFRYPGWVESIRAMVPPDIAFLGVELFKWLIVIGAALVIVPVSWLCAWVLAWLIRRPGAPLHAEIRGILTGPLVGLVTLLLLRDLLLELGIGATAARIMRTHTLSTFFALWFLWKAVDLWRARRRLRYEAEGRTDAAVLGRPVANAIKLVTLLLAVLVWLANAGVEITALLAGLGIGGIAVGLALQKPIEDVFGAVSIYSQQPVNTGDLCRYGNEVGRVEEIGLRTTRIRTLANSLVSVPNAHFSTGVIENLTARTKIMYGPDLPLRYDTTREQVQEVLAKLEQMLIDNPRIENDTVRVRLAEFSPNAIIVRMRVFALTREFEEYLEIVQEVNLDIMRIMAEVGAHFAQGAQTLFIEGGSPSALQPAAETRN